MQEGKWPRLRRNVRKCLLAVGTLLAGLCLSGGISQATEPATARAQAYTTYYVRPDGGSPTQCTGLVNAPYPGTGTDQPCAWDHPFRALPPGGPPRIAGGDTLIIAAGSYRMGYGAPGAETCDAAYPWDCYMAPIPSGPDSAHPTRVLGEGWDTGCANPPELWGAERANMVVNLTDAHNVEIACLEITDHDACVDSHAHGMGGSPLTCNATAFPYGDWALTGLYAEDSTNVHLKDLRIHGLAHAGINAGRLADWTVEDVRIVANGWVGWDGDIYGRDANAGMMIFRRWTVAWNGCGETYPGEEPIGCWAQTAGGYGDGVGTGETGGDWIIEDAAFLYNTSDGLDLLYHRLGGRIVLRRVRAEGNAGNPVKVNGDAYIENSVIVGNCGYFRGQPFTYNVDDCRAAGNALAINLSPGNAAVIVNNTITGEGDCLVEIICDGSCDGTETVRMRNNLFLGQIDFISPSERTCLIYEEGFLADPVDADYSLIAGVKDDPCPLGPHDVCRSPRLRSADVDAFDGHLLADSPAIDAGDSSFGPPIDFDHRPRDTRPDIGAYEWQKRETRLYLPAVFRGTAW